MSRRVRPAPGTRPDPRRLRDQLRDHEEERRRCRSAIPAIAPDALTSDPSELIPRNVTPDTIAGWQAAADAFLTNEACAFHRNVEISSRYALIYRLLPTCFKWAAMAAIASHHVRLALFPLRLDADRTGYVDIPHSLLRQKLLRMDDVHVIRATNNAIFHDIFWVHLAYASADNGIERVRALLDGERRYAPVLSGFETIDRARHVLEDDSTSTEARRVAENLIWEGNVQLLEHEQRALVQPCFDRLSCAFARVISLGSATTFEARGMRHEAAYFTSFYLSSLMRGVPHVVGAKGWPTNHALRRPLVLARGERHSPLPETRCRRAQDRRRPATHLRRSAQLRIDALCTPPSAPNGASRPMTWSADPTRGCADRG